jgi:hypothetical protein
MAKLSYAKIKKALADREEFEGNSMWATYEHSDGAWWGMLPEHDKMFLSADMERAKETMESFYIVYSYETPIAWAYGDTVRVPEVKYSVTTSKQQTLVRGYLR